MRLTVITGPMFSGKSHELVRLVGRAVIAHKKVLAVKPSIDRRYSIRGIVAHDGVNIAAYPIPPEHPEQIIDLCQDMKADMIAIDEVQFFSPKLVDVVLDLLPRVQEIVAAGLDLSYRGEIFPVTCDLMAYADHVRKLSAVCSVCKGDASLTQMVVDGKPYTKPLAEGGNIKVGGRELYEARCRKCWVGPDKDV